MEGLLLVLSSVAVLVGLGALVEAARPRRGGKGESRSRAQLDGILALHSRKKPGQFYSTQAFEKSDPCG